MAFTGCQYPFEFKSEAEIKEQVLGKEPGFAKVLDARQRLDEKITSLKQSLSAKRKSIDAKIRTLKSELSTLKQNTATETAKLDAQLDPLRLELKDRVRGLLTELKLKESSLSATNKMVAKLEKMVENSSSSENLTKEMPKWKDKISSLRVQASELEAAVSSIREKILHNRLKLKLIR